MEKRIKELELLVEKYRNIAFKDKLTGVYNNNWFMYNIHKLDRHLAMVDINDLKETNDTMGHKEGDLLILRVVDRLKKVGLVARIGGDEFLILSRNLSKLRELEQEKGREFAIGVVVKNEVKTIGEAVRLADKRMYLDKRVKH